MTTSSTYLVSTTQPPTLVCPTWCAVPREEHLEALEEWEGRLIHHSSAFIAANGSFSASLACGTTVDGVIEPNDPVEVHVHDIPNSMSPEQAYEVAQRLAALVQEVRA